MDFITEVLPYSLISSLIIPILNIWHTKTALMNSQCNSPNLVIYTASNCSQLTEVDNRYSGSHSSLNRRRASNCGKNSVHVLSSDGDASQCTVPLFAGTTFPDTSEALTQMEDAVLQISAAGKPGTTC